MSSVQMKGNTITALCALHTMPAKRKGDRVGMSQNVQEMFIIFSKNRHSCVYYDKEQDIFV